MRKPLSRSRKIGLIEVCSLILMGLKGLLTKGAVGKAIIQKIKQR
ncbi:hypothetical protein [Limosilactobacillus mucosae]|nr:hypothetical protein [Limosilactobacillus mucosae]MDC2840622.1 hypothetical protein [Limosilactobacillus mucosae]